MVIKMVKGLIGKKLNMSQTYDKHGRSVPVTRIMVTPNLVVQLKDTAKDGYRKAQLGSGENKRALKPLLGHAKKAGLDKAPRYLREFGFEGDLKIGQTIEADEVFRVGSLVDVVGISKGKGFAGVVKRWGFSGGPRTHGQSDRERAGGSIGATTTPGRVFKGMKMAGHMGDQQVSVAGLEIIDIDKENNELIVRGSVPGSLGSIVLINKSRKKKKAYHEAEIPTAPVVSGDKEEKSEAETAELKQPELVENKTEENTNQDRGKEGGEKQDG